jgi:hypothetical protein
LRICLCALMFCFLLLCYLHTVTSVAFLKPFFPLRFCTLLNSMVMYIVIVALNNSITLKSFWIWCNYLYLYCMSTSWLSHNYDKHFYSHTLTYTLLTVTHTNHLMYIQAKTFKIYIQTSIYEGSKRVILTCDMIPTH